MNLLTILALLLVGATPASARDYVLINEWECGKAVTVELRKYGTAAYELIFSGAFTVWSPTGKPTTGVNFKYVGRDEAILNGKRCHVLPHDPEQGKND
jgi:hypothetical protein